MRLGYLGLNSITEGVLFANAQGIIEFVNIAFTRLTGFAESDLLGTQCSAKLQGPLTDKNAILQMRHARLNDIAFHGDVLNYKKDGSTFWNSLTITPIFNEALQLTHYISITRDISAIKLAALTIKRQRDDMAAELSEKTGELKISLANSNFTALKLAEKNHDLKMAQTVLLESEERLSLAIRSAGIGIWDLNLQTMGLIWDNSMLALFGVERADFSNTIDGWRDCIHPDDRDYAENQLNAAIYHQQPLDFVFRIVCKKTEIRHIKALGTVFYDENGQPLRVLGTNIDVTKLAWLDQLKSEFCATAAHELRTPMTVIFGYAELLKNMPLDTQLQKEAITTLYQQSSLMIELLNDILDMSKLEQQAANFIQMRPQAIGLIIQGLVSTIMLDANHKRVLLDISANLPDVNVDKAKIEQVIKNLLSNASKFSPQGGEISMQVSQVIHEEVPKVLICIEDHGIGMTAEQLKHVYDKFYRADQSGKIPGTGLGMAIVKDILTYHGGCIEIKSQFGQGTQVMVYLPIAEV